MRKESIINQLGPHTVNHIGEAPHKQETKCEEPDTPQITKLPLRKSDNNNSGDNTEDQVTHSRKTPKTGSLYQHKEPRVPPAGAAMIPSNQNSSPRQTRTRKTAGATLTQKESNVCQLVPYTVTHMGEVPHN